MELVVTDLAASREFYVDVLGLYVTEEDDERSTSAPPRSSSTTTSCCARARRGRRRVLVPRAQEDLDRAVAFYTELGCDVARARAS
jgi:catechol 2,3-dioxygenase-like lactoylglutathione lyase family enzyme